MNHLIANISGKTRREKLHGRDHLVAPIAMIVPGVLNGSNGPILYRKEDIEKSVDAWNGMPITVYHPKRPISARSPEILNSQGVGVVLNARIKEGVLRADGWFNLEDVARVDNRLSEALLNGEKIELSTGLGMDEESVEDGVTTTNGEPYKSIARNFRPDHLAILPDQIGACSVKQGCGVCNKEGGEEETEFHSNINDIAGRNEEEDESRNIGHEEVRAELSRQLDSLYIRRRDELGILGESKHNWVLSDVFDSYIIYRQGESLFKVSYMKTGESIILSDDPPAKVRREISFVPVTTTNSTSTGDSEVFNKEKVVTGLITNCACWTDAEKDILNAMSEEQLTRLATEAAQNITATTTLNAITSGSVVEVDGTSMVFNTTTNLFEKKGSKGKKKPGDDEEDDDEEEDTKGKKKGKAMNSAGQGMGEDAQTKDQWFAAAPPEVQNTLRYAEQIQNAHRAGLVKKIIDAAPEAQRELLKPVYNSMAIDQLEAIAAAVPAPVETPTSNYLAAFVPPVVQNNNAPKEEPLGIPEMVW